MRIERDLNAQLERWLDAGLHEIGQVRIEPRGDGFALRHRDEKGTHGLQVFRGSKAARDLARDDARGRFRPLKTAPNLRRGWDLRLSDVAELRQALDYFYPAALGLYRAYVEGELHPVNLRSTLERQTGMYAVARRISDEDADAMVGRCCKSEGGCLRTILWRIDNGRPVTSLPASKFEPTTARGIPLLCRELCNLMVAEARKVVKAEGGK